MSTFEDAHPYNLLKISEKSVGNPYYNNTFDINTLLIFQQCLHVNMEFTTISKGDPFCTHLQSVLDIWSCLSVGAITQHVSVLILHCKRAVKVSMFLKLFSAVCVYLPNLGKDFYPVSIAV